MCGLQNFHIDWLIDTEKQPNQRIGQTQNIGRIDDNGDYFLRSDEITHLTKKYHLLYQNLIITFISSVVINQKIDDKIFILPVID